MMEKGSLGVSIIWHMHQPYYGVGDSRLFRMPWVRLHGTKDYYDMAAIVRDHPGVRITFNFVPCLLKQLAMYVEGGASDTVSALSLADNRNLPDRERRLLPHLLFMLHPKIIEQFPRYSELYQKWLGAKEDGKGGEVFTDAEIADLQLLYNLAWFDPTFFSRPELKALIEKGKGFLPEERRALSEVTKDVLSDIIPIYRQLLQEKKIELSSSPFYHPILPLLLDTDVAREACHESDLPSGRFSYPEDVRKQITSAIDYHNEVFGEKPRGMWPSEGSVSNDLIPYLIDAGLKWVASDEAVLHKSLEEEEVDWSERGEVLPASIYRPYFIERESGDIGLFFRDRYLSDQIGFTYHHMDTNDAIAHMKSYFKKVRERAVESGIESPLVTIVVDGENPWENYPNDGADFLHELYQHLESEGGLTALTPSDYIAHIKERSGEQARLDYLSPGSWIGGNFKIWIGHPENNRAWELLKETREYLKSRDNSQDVKPELLERAWEEIYIAEGSDWFWWYGDDFHSEMDSDFDAIFRTHLQSVYELLGDCPPDKLFEAIAPAPDAARRLVRRVSGALVELDGEISSSSEWDHAARYDTRYESPLEWETPAMIEAIMWGCSDEELTLRCDFRVDAPIDHEDSLLVTIYAHERAVITIPAQKGSHELLGGNRVVGRSVRDEILEVSLSLSSLNLIEQGDIAFNIKEIRSGRVMAIHPAGELFTVLNEE